MGTINVAETDEDVALTFRVFRQLRVHFTDVDIFVKRVRTQITQGFVLVYLLDDGVVRAIAGYRIADNLEDVESRYMYIADLCTDSEARSKGYGEQLWQYLEAVAKQEGCSRILLDSGTQRTRAHKFYLNRGMVIRAFNFSKHL